MEPWIVEGIPSVNMTAHICHSPISWQLATSLRGELASARTHHSITRYAVEETRSGTSANARACGVKRGYSAEGSSEIELGWTGRVTSRRSFVISLLVVSIREPAAALRQSGPASSAWQEHHELPLICLLHGPPTGCTTCGLE